MIRQVGREAVLDEAVRQALPGWYEEAVLDAGVATVGDPKLDLADLPERGSPLEFSIEVGVVPPAQLGEYKGVEVGRREPAVDADARRRPARAGARAARLAGDRRARRRPAATSS